jgi:hypothetical protein
MATSQTVDLIQKGSTLKQRQKFTKRSLLGKPILTIYGFAQIAMAQDFERTHVMSSSMAIDYRIYHSSVSKKPEKR